MTWGFIWLMFIMKIPIVGLFTIVWWAIRSTDEPAPEQTVRAQPRPQPHRPPRPRRPRPRSRGPHGGPASLPSPPRVRPIVAIGQGAAARERRSGR